MHIESTAMKPFDPISTLRRPVDGGASTTVTEPGYEDSPRDTK